VQISPEHAVSIDLPQGSFVSLLVRTLCPFSHGLCKLVIYTTQCYVLLSSSFIDGVFVVTVIYSGCDQRRSGTLGGSLDNGYV